MGKKKKRGPLVKKDGTEHNSREKQRREGKCREREREKERQTCLSLPSLWYDKFMHSSCVCQSRPGVFVGQFLREEGGKKREERKGRIGRRGRGVRKRKRGERAETLSSNSRKWVDPDRGRFCSLCGFNESTVFRTRRGTRELA